MATKLSSSLTSPFPIPHSPLAKRIGLLAGWGRFPIVVAENLRRQGYETYCLGVKGHADAALANVCTDFDWVGLGKLGRVVRYFRGHDVCDMVMAGKIHKFRLFQPGAWFKHLPDWPTMRGFYKHLLLRQKDQQDDTLLMGVVNVLSNGGLHVAAATDLVPELLVKFGCLTRRGPTPAERKDIEYGWKVAKELGRLDIGQSVAVKGQAAMAVEAIEGTDQCIERAGRLCTSGGFTVVKVAKPQQDMRFDVPTIGLGTLETMVRAGAKCLAVEADKTILLDQADVIRYADEHRLAIVALERADQVPSETT
jgi:DUF1009 family protein